MEHSAAGSVANIKLQPLIEPLTPRELEVLQLVCDGASNLEIAAALSVATSTVKYHVFQIFQKLGVERRTQAVAIAVHLQIVSPGWVPRLSSNGKLPGWKPLGWKVFQTAIRVR
ncbi:response regulator transcription factor [Nevskia sp.]|uniref:helix-turn-helix domain-containing protein n=1 Tax=Nevskia sp. TaxID=1929292 RepID=UPI0025F728E4|nr:response regulator transcription factor [Nevskia sp.]